MTKNLLKAPAGQGNSRRAFKQCTKNHTSNFGQLFVSVNSNLKLELIPSRRGGKTKCPTQSQMFSGL